MAKKAGVDPKVVATIRGLIEAALLAAVNGVLVAATEADWKELAPYQPLFFLVIRMIEGWIDAYIDPTKQRVLGGKSAR